MEFLKREGLYSPQMKEIRTDDPTATDLIGALLTVSFFYNIKKKFEMLIFFILNIYSKDLLTFFHLEEAQMIR